LKIDQLFEFVYILIDKKKVTAKKMAEHFGISERTIYRWVDALCISGIPVYSQKGRNGGIVISDKYSMDNTVLSEEEKLAIVSSVKALNALTANPASIVNANVKAAEKISGLVSSDTDWLEVDFSPWSPEGAGVRNLFEILKNSILTRHQVSFDYFRGDGQKEKRVVHPWKLIFRGQSWYLSGWCTKRRDQRYFKLTRMRNVIMTSAPLTITEQKVSLIHDKKNIKNNSSLNESIYPLVTIRARVSAKKISYVLDSFICDNLISHKDKSVTLTFTAPDSPWLCEQLLGLGSDIKIMTPKKIQKQIMELADNLLSNYRH